MSESAIRTGEGTEDSPIVLCESPSPKPSPVKVVPRSEYRSFLERLNCSDSEEEDGDQEWASDSDQVASSSVEESFVSEDESDEDTEDIARNARGAPIYERPPAKYSASQILKLLLDPKIDEARVCSVRPCEVSCCSTFIVDLTKLAHPDDIKKDMYGRWQHSGSHPEVFRCWFDQYNEVRIEKCAPGATGSNVYYLRRLHSYHPSNPKFRRLLAFISDAANNPHRLCLAAYYLPEGFEPIPTVHGNSKSDKPYFPTLPSTLQKIKDECTTSGPKSVIANVSAHVGGILSASDACELPRGEQQVSQAKLRLKRTTAQSTLDRCAPDDELAVVMQQAFMEDKSNCFIRDVRMFREPAIVVANDRQLDDLVRFCTDPSKFGLMTIDPTFSLGDFDVTVITYRHLLLLSQRTQKPPVFVGPVLIHYRKSFGTYLFFASTLVSLRRQLTDVKCFGTDGEESLSEAFQHEFQSSLHLLCFIHMQRNVKAKLMEIGISEGTRQLIVDDIFGKKVGSHYVEGLVDATSEADYEEGLSHIIAQWEALDSSKDGPIHTFVAWFKRYKSDAVKKNMLRPVREQAGLGCPPDAFTTNASESVNALLMNKVDYKRQELPNFLKKLKEAVDEQENELSRAVIGRGKYSICPGFQKLLLKTEQDWFVRMTASARMKHLKKVASIKVWETDLEEEARSIAVDQPGPSGMNSRSSRRRLFASAEIYHLSVGVNEFADQVTVPLSILEGIWEKAAQIIASPAATAAAPGYDAKARMVKSSSGNRPHLVLPKRSGQYACDSACGNWKSLGLCSHSVAVAEQNSELCAFVNWFKQSKKKPNLTKLVLTGMPEGRGRKGGVAPRRRKKSVLSTSRTPLAAQLSSHSVPLLSSTTTIPSAAQPPEISPPTARNFTLGPPPLLPAPATVTTLAASVIEPIRTTTVTETCVANGPPPLVSGTTLNSQASSSSMLSPALSLCPRSPPAIVPSSSTSNLPGDSPFTLCFVTGNIRVCRGCRQKYPKPSIPPMDLCVRHQEWQEFFPPGSPVAQVRYGNVYYHCNVPCIQARCPYFKPEMLTIPALIAAQLLPVHSEHLANHMGRT